MGFFITVQIKLRVLITGKGVKLTYDGQDVYAECLSDSAVFVQSPLINQLNNRNPNEVIRFPRREFVFSKYMFLAFHQ